MMIGQSLSMKELRARITRVATTQFTVLIEGESGAGKELVAREIHQLSPRRGGPFVPVNCAALVDSLLEAELFGIEERTATGVRGRRGKFELADHGTLFLDEVGDLSPAAQAKLLRVLQDFSVERVGGGSGHRVDTRVLVATNRGLRSLVEAGQFRADLYYRISGVEIIVPPLRDRRQDVPLLVDYFTSRNRRIRDLPVDTTALSALVAYNWPGNVRQLARALERALALSPGPSISVGDLPADITRQYRESGGGSEDADRTMRGCIGRYARLVFDECQGNKRRACEILDISYHTLQTYLDYAPGQNAAAPRAPMDAPSHAPAMTSTFCERAG
jgi:transcriptional regulator with GAF, ATPase, and Fis domain